MGKENSIELNCENCDTEFKIVALPGSEDPVFCPFCGEKEINIVESNEIDYEYASDVEDEDEVIEED